MRRSVTQRESSPCGGGSDDEPASEQQQQLFLSSLYFEDDENDITEDNDIMSTTTLQLATLATTSTDFGESLPLLENTSDHGRGGNFPSDSSSSDTERRLTAPRNASRSAFPSSDNSMPLDAPIIHVIDRIEDEVEAHAYEDLVPLEVKLALEDKVFGWSHLTSAFLGHVMFTIGSYYVVNELIKAIWSAFSKTSTMPPYVVALRIGLSLWAAVNAYRFVRRRRQVWFRAAYGTKAYKKDEARRRQSVQETDRSTAIGRMIRRFQHRRTLKKLRKAEKMFAKRHHAMKQREQELQQLVTRPLIKRQDSAGEDSFSSCGSGSESSGSSSTESGNTSYESATTSTDTTEASCPSPQPGRKRQRRPSFNTNPTNRMRSYAHDQILFPSITNMPYAHGGFFGTAPFLLANPHWISILRHLMPDVYVEISRRVAQSPASKLIHWAENNPVVAAYGAAHELEYCSSGKIPNLEWDVFLDPILVRRVQIVLEARENYLATTSGSKSSPRTKSILQYYRTELRKRSQALVDKMLIAHGNLTQLITEQTGYAKHYNYSRVKRTRQTLGGGIYARQWMAVFAEALKLGVVGPLASSTTSTTEEAALSLPVSSKTASLLALADSKCPETTMSESVRIVESIVKSKEPLGLVLDLKSRHIPKRIWSIVVDTLRSSGIRVEGIASFSTEETRGVSRWCERPVQEIIFFHSAGDLQKACHEGRIHHHDTVFLNGGSLIAETRSPDFMGRLINFDPQEIKKSYRIQPFGMPRQPSNDDNENAADAYPTIQLYKEYYSLSIGLYCQEFAIDEAAIHLLSQHVNKNPELFDLGLSWGGVNGITIQGISPGRFTSTDGFWNQRYIGEQWDYNLLPMMGNTSSTGKSKATVA